MEPTKKLSSFVDPELRAEAGRQAVAALGELFKGPVESIEEQIRALLLRVTTSDRARTVYEIARDFTLELENVVRTKAEEDYEERRLAGRENDVECQEPGIRVIFRDVDGFRSTIEEGLKRTNIEAEVKVLQKAEEPDPEREEDDPEYEPRPELLCVDLPRGCFVKSDEINDPGVYTDSESVEPFNKLTGWGERQDWRPIWTTLLFSITGLRQSGFVRIESLAGKKPAYHQNPRYNPDGTSLKGVA